MEKELLEYEVRRNRVKEAVAHPKAKKIKVVFLKDGKLRSF